ncbi:MAG: metal-dependent hydrolase [Acidimicrobiia bacterium]|nr:metal-dependent hydrolase [Acidimicrobiia bacterium]
MDAAPRSKIEVRRPRFDWTATPLHWVGGDVQTTHTLNCLHLLLPAGERWLIDVFGRAAPLITDHELRGDVRALMGQESTHSRAHDAALDQMAAHGLDASRFKRRVDRAFGLFGGDRLFGQALSPALTRAWLLRRVAALAAIEHFTALLGDWIVERSGALDRPDVDPVMLDLLRWHGAEEIEHRSVAFDVHRHLGGTHRDRVVTMLIAVPTVLAMWLGGLDFLLRHDPTLEGRRRRISVPSFVRAGREGRLPTVGYVLRGIAAYLRPGFHPSQRGNTERALAYLATSRAVG